MTENEQQKGERIAKTIARAGLCSRREAERWIEAGRVQINNRKIDSPANLVTSDDIVMVDGKLLPERAQQKLWRYHKPPGLLVSHGDPQGRATVFEKLPVEMPRVMSIGRLDYNTEGLLLLTNDGALARRLELPETAWLRRYRVRAHGRVEPAQLLKLNNGVTIDGIKYGPVQAKFDQQQGANVWLTLALREGKNREVKRICDHLGLQVNRLIRTSFGPFQLGDLVRGGVEQIPANVLRDQLGPAADKAQGRKTRAHRRRPV